MSTYRRTRLRPPYNPDGSTAFPARGVPGCYLIYKEHDDVVGVSHELRYVGYSASDVYKALYRHFQTWNDKQVDRGERSERTVYSVRKDIRVRVIYCRTAAQARELEKALILRYRPTDNPDKLALLELTEDGRAMASEAMKADIITSDDVPF